MSYEVYYDTPYKHADAYAHGTQTFSARGAVLIYELLLIPVYHVGGLLLDCRLVHALIPCSSTLIQIGTIEWLASLKSGGGPMPCTETSQSAAQTKGVRVNHLLILRRTAFILPLLPVLMAMEMRNPIELSVLMEVV